MRKSMKMALLLTLLTLPNAAFAQQQPNNIVLSESATRQMSPHVFAIYGNPNIAIVVGTKATLVIDTGLGPRNGQFIAGEVAKVRKSPKLFLTTTHAHPEHSSGQDGFPADTVVIRPRVQQQELEEIGPSGIDGFAARSAVNRELLAGAHIGKSDILFDDELMLDLGEVTARLSWFGPAHSNGDVLTLIEPDGVLVSGDVVQNKAGPSLSGSRSTIKSWIAVLDKIAPLNPKLILPDHSQPGDAGLIPEQRAFLVDLQGRIDAAKSQHKSADEAARLISADFKARYPGWTRLQFLERSVMVEYEAAAN
jgi:glyoxylase-like metal-dependent hydrolase (beta-lactamase superfamily II)